MKDFFRSLGEKLNAMLFGWLYSIGAVACVIPPTPNANSFQQYRVTDPNQSEVLWNPLYDWLGYPTAGLQQFTFFSNPIGAGKTSTPGATAATPKQLSDTNMQQGSQLSSGMEFLCYGIEIYFLPGSVSTTDTYTPAKLTTDATGALLAASVSAVNDVSQVYNEGLFQFSVLNKTQLTDTPLRKFTPANWIELDAAFATTNSSLSLAALNARAKGDPFVFATPIALQSVTTFNATISYPAARALPSGFNGRIGVVLNGFTKRAAQ